MTRCVHIIVEHPAWLARAKLLQDAVRMALRATLDHIGMKEAELSVALMGDAQIHRLNHDFRGIDKPTNVLAFAADEKNYLGDIAISLETLAGEAMAQGKRFEDHLAHLVVHATLHLLGYDHEYGDEAEVMETIEIVILRRLGIANPYRD